MSTGSSAGATEVVAATGGESVPTEAAGGESSPEESEAAAATEERMDAAAPEQADEDAAAEMTDDPETQDHAPPNEPAAESIAPSITEGAPEANDRPSSSPEVTSEGSGGSEDPAAPTHPESVTSSSTSASAETAESAGGVLESGEQQAALSSMAEETSGGGEAPAASGGGGGGTAIPEPPTPEVPDVTGQDPEAALSSVQHLPPAQMQQALGGVTQSVENSVEAQRSGLQANPPEMERPSGSPMTGEGPATRRSEGTVGEQTTVARVSAGQEVPTPGPTPLPPAPPAPTRAVPEPQVVTPPGGQVSEDDAREVQSSVRRLPVSDPGLGVPSEPPPRIALEGDADPGQTQEQNTRLQESVGQAQAQGRRDAAQPMGEDAIYPTVPRETLRAQTIGRAVGAATAPVPATSMPAGSGGAGGGNPTEEAASIVAQQEHGEEIRAAVGSARSAMTTRRQDHARQVSEERASNRRQMSELEQENASQQSQERSRAREEVQQARGEWSEAQQQEADRANEEAGRETSRGDEQIGREQTQADRESAQHVESGEQEAEGHRQRAETQASQARSEAEQESDGIFGWLASRARAFFDRIKRGITAIFDAARRLVRAAIERARQLAVAVIERARRTVVGIIRTVGAALIAIGDRVLAAFPALRARFRRFIEQRIAAAEAAVNRLADALKAGVQRLLDALGAALDAALGLLQRGLLAAVNAANAVVQRAINAARAVVQAFGAFLVLIRDVAAGPARWIRNLAAAVVDGIRNHLWRAFREAVRNWFNSKLEEVLGIGGMIWGVLRRGGIQIAQVGSMVWEGLKSAIPIALVTILIEKLVAMIVPAAGAVIAIIEGLQAAWGTVSRIIAAFSQFFAFLRAVRSGNAGSRFAAALAAAAVVVIDFVANWLIRRIRRPAGRIAGRIRALAQRIMQRVRRAASRVGGAVRRAGRRITGAMRGARDRFRAWRNRRRARRQDPNQRARDRERARDRARTETRAAIERSLERGLPMALLRAQVAYLRMRYRWHSLVLQREGPEGFSVIGSFSPPARVAAGTVSIQIVSVPAAVHGIRGIGRAAVSGAEWERATNPFIGRALAAQLGRPGQPLNLAPQQRIQSEGFYRVPDWREADLPEAARARGQMQIVEQTIVTNFLAANVFARHKRVQLPMTVLLLQRQHPGVPIVYHIVCPQAPPPAARADLTRSLQQTGANVTVVFRVLGG